MATPMKINQRLQRNGSPNIALGLGSRHLLVRRIEAVDVRLMMVLVMQLHDLAGDGGLESAVIVCNRR